MIKVRFNLSRGKNYKKWKIAYPDNHVEYRDPNEVQLIMIGCQLKNNRKSAEKIFEGANKFVCAWVECQFIALSGINTVVLDSEEVKYNPRVAPNWTKSGENVDDVYFDHIVSLGRKLYTR